MFPRFKLTLFFILKSFIVVLTVFREIKDLNGQIIAENGNINCWKNLGADDQTDIRIAEVDFYDVCYTRRETSITNTTEETVIRRGVFYGQVDP